MNKVQNASVQMQSLMSDIQNQKDYFFLFGKISSHVKPTHVARAKDNGDFTILIDLQGILETVTVMNFLSREEENELFCLALDNNYWINNPSMDKLERVTYCENLWRELK